MRSQLWFGLLAFGLPALIGCGEGPGTGSGLDGGVTGTDAAPPSFEGCLQAPLWPIDPADSIHWDVGGAPNVMQVFVRGSRESKLVFGQHTVTPTDTSHGSKPKGAVISVILDEPVKGSAFQEVECLNGRFSRVPDGTTSAEVQACRDYPYTNCTKVCVFDGKPAGIPDDYIALKLIDNATDPSACQAWEGATGDTCEPSIRLVCDGDIIPVSGQGSYYLLRGHQQTPTSGAPVHEILGALGPALHFAPWNLPTGAACTVSFLDTVTDCDGNTVADTNQVHFNVEPLTLIDVSPRINATVPANPGVPASIFLEFNAEIDPTSTQGITLTGDGTPVPFTAHVLLSDLTEVRLVLPDGYTPGTMYSLTLPPSLAEVLGGTLGAPFEVYFKTLPE